VVDDSADGARTSSTRSAIDGLVYHCVATSPPTRLDPMPFTWPRAGASFAMADVLRVSSRELEHKLAALGVPRDLRYWAEPPRTRRRSGRAPRRAARREVVVGSSSAPSRDHNVDIELVAAMAEQRPRLAVFECSSAPSGSAFGQGPRVSRRRAGETCASGGP
jgi:hypothetical protein